MGDTLGINFPGFDDFSGNTQTYAGYFNQVSLVNTAPNCSIEVNNNMNVTYGSDQQSIDLLGDLLNLEAEKLGNVSASFQYLEDTLSKLYNPG